MTHDDVKRIVFNQNYSNNQSSTYQQDKFYEKLDVLKEKDNVNHPDHYQSKNSENIQCIDAITACLGVEKTKAFCLGNSLKYIWRCYSKEGNESIKKSIWYLNRFLELGGCDS